MLLSYLVLALSWWGILLYNKNEELYEAKLEVIELKQLEPTTQIESSNALKKEYKRQRLMIIGESLFLGMSLLAGIWIILNAAKRLEKINRLQNNFLHAITHELKSPIASIKLVLQTFKKRQLNKAQTEQIAQNAVSEVNRLDKLVDQLLLSAQLEDNYKYYYESIALEPFFLKLRNTLQHLYPGRTIKQHLDLDFENIKFDVSALRSIYENLVDNALKYSTEEVSVHIYNQAQHLYIEVTDKGPGIKPDSKAGLTKKFFRIGDETVRKTKGTGLGLYIVNEIVMANNGTLSIKNGNPKGAIFIASVKITEA